PPSSTLFPYTTLFRSLDVDLPRAGAGAVHAVRGAHDLVVAPAVPVEGVALAAAGQLEAAQVGRDLVRGQQLAGAQQELGDRAVRSEEHTSELQSRENL